MFGTSGRRANVCAIIDHQMHALQAHFSSPLSSAHVVQQFPFHGCCLCLVSRTRSTQNRVDTFSTQHQTLLIFHFAVDRKSLYNRRINKKRKQKTKKNAVCAETMFRYTSREKHAANYVRKSVRLE